MKEITKRQLLDRIAALEAENQRLQMRVTVLEARRVDPSHPHVQPAYPYSPWGPVWISDRAHDATPWWQQQGMTWCGGSHDVNNVPHLEVVA